MNAGWAMVGESGPELVNFDRPGRVYTAGQTEDILGASGHAQKLDEISAAVGAGVRVDQSGYRSILEVLTSIDDRLSTVESANKLAGVAA